MKWYPFIVIVRHSNILWHKNYLKTPKTFKNASVIYTNFCKLLWIITFVLALFSTQYPPHCGLYKKFFLQKKKILSLFPIRHFRLFILFFIVKALRCITVKVLYNFFTSHTFYSLPTSHIINNFYGETKWANLCMNKGRKTWIKSHIKISFWGCFYLKRVVVVCLLTT